MLKNKGKSIAKAAVGLTAGAALGVAVYNLLGCPTGGCIITSSPWSAGAYGAAVGTLWAVG
jgi:hypothetical protein